MKKEKRQINAAELSNEIQNIIQESYRAEKTPDLAERFSIKEHVNNLLATTKNVSLTAFLLRVNENLERGVKDIVLFEAFGRGLEKFSDIKAVKQVIDQLNAVSKDNAALYECLMIANTITDEYVNEQLVESINAYFNEPNDFTKEQIKDAIENVHNLNESQKAARLSLIVSNVENAQPTYFSSVSLNESANLVKRQNQSRDEVIQKKIQESVERLIEQRLSDHDAEERKLAEQNTLSHISNKMGLLESINRLMRSDAAKGNQKLMDKLSQFSSAIAQGCYEERVYESFIQQITPFNYLKPVENTIKTINEKANENPDSLLLTRILEEMSEAADSYIYREMVEEDVCRFINNPSPENRIQALNACMPYATNRFVNKILETIYRISDNRFAGSISEAALSIKDQISMIKENVSVYNMYSPVLYIKEGQSVFAVGNSFYLKNGNIIAPLSKEYIPKLDEKFVQLAHLVNNPNVKIVEDKIYLSGEDLYATIYEDRVIISDGTSQSIEDATSLRRLNEMCMKYGTYGNTEFFIMASCLIENFNNIAPLSFAKRVMLNENKDISCELFRLDENIFIATHNYSIQQNTFYRNVNPIFARNTINEHFGINVGRIFEDLLPDQEKIMIQLYETKNEYEKSIEDYENAIQELEDAKENATTAEIEKELDAAIEDTKQKLEDVKKEYRQWQDSADETIKGSKEEEEDDEENVTKEVSNEPLDADEVEDHESELSIPLGNTDAQEGAPADEAGSEVSQVTDDEFSDFLATDASDETVNPDDEIDTTSDDTEFISTADADTEEPVVAEEPAAEEPTDNTDTISIADETPAEDDDEELGDDIYEEPAQEDIPSDEDILTDVPAENGEEDIYQNGEEDGETFDIVDGETGEKVPAGAEATDLFGGDTEDPLGTHKEIDNELYNPNTQTSEFNIVNVMFDENVKEGTIMKSGQVLALKPMVDVDGRKYVEDIVVKFYLNGENQPVLQQTENMSTAMYSAIVNAITSHPSYSNVCENGISMDGGESVANAEIAEVQPDLETQNDETWEDEYREDGNAEDRGEYELQVNADEPAAGEVVSTEDDVDIVPADEPVAPADAPASDVEDFDIENIFDLGEEEPVAADEPAVPAEAGTPEPAPAEAPVVAAEEPVSDPVETYTDPDGTEIEVPADNAGEETPEDGEEKSDEENSDDDTLIPESHKREVSKEQINENRKSILSVKAKIVK